MSTQQVNYNINVTGNLQAKLDKATKGFDKLDKEVDGLKKKLGKAQGTGGSGLAGSFAGLGGVIAGAFAVERVFAFGKASVEAFDKQEQAIAQVKAGLESTGNTAGRTLDQLTTQASELQKRTIFGDEEILQGATAQLLTFTNIAGTQFDRTQQAVLDLSSRLNVDLKSSAIQLGKALNDPVANLSALSRSGIQFSKEQKEVIKSLAESNRLADAQSIILTELEKQYGGSAEAAAKAGLGPFKQLQNAFGDLQEEIGKGLLGDTGGGIGALMKGVDFLKNNVGELIEAYKELFMPAVNIFQMVTKLIPKFKGLGSTTKLLGNIFRVTTSPMRLAWWLLEKLVQGVTWAITKFKEFAMSFDFVRNGINGLIEAFKFFTQNFEDIPIILSSAFGAFMDFYKGLFKLTINTADGIFMILKEAFDVEKIIKGNTTGITDAVRTASDRLERDLKNLDIKANFKLRLAEGRAERATGPTGVGTGLASALTGTSAGALGTTDTELTKIDDEVTGTKATNINLNIDKLIENLNFNTTSLQESTTKIKDEVTRVLIEALRDTTAIATN